MDAVRRGEMIARNLEGGELMRHSIAVLLVLALSSVARADDFGTGGNAFDIDFVPISGSTNPASGYGVVVNDYRMGVQEITNDQWDKFVTIYGTPTGDPLSAYGESFYNWGTTGTTDVPANNVSWYEAAQMVNWLNTSTGHQAAYKFTGTQGTSGYAFDTWSAAEAAGGTNLYRHKDAFYFLPSEDEWVKAAYWNGTTLQSHATKAGDTLHQGNGTSGTGWNYGYAINSPSYGTWNVGSGSQELNGTYDMMGNLYEWMESPWISGNYVADSAHGLRGGNFSNASYVLDASYRVIIPTYESPGLGFRVASVASEPSTHVLSVGVDWGSSLRGDLDADHLASVFNSAMPSVGEPEVLLMDSSEAANLTAFENNLEAIIEDADPGDTIILTFASHGDSLVEGTEPSVATDLGDGTFEARTGDEYVLLSDQEADRLYDDYLADLLGDERLNDVRKIVIFDNCRSGGFGPDLTDEIPNIAVLAGCGEGGFTFSDADGTGLFTNSIVDGLTRDDDGFWNADGATGVEKDGIVTLDELETHIAAFDFGDLIGQELPLRYLDGSYTFQGLSITVSASDDFDGIVAVPEPSTLILVGTGALALLAYAWRKRRRLS